MILLLHMLLSWPILLTESRSIWTLFETYAQTGGSGHIVIFNTLAVGHTKHPNEQSICSSGPFEAKILKGTNRQDFVCIHPPGISHGAFELRMNIIWFCKIFTAVSGQIKDRPRTEETLVCLRLSTWGIHRTSATWWINCYLLYLGCLLYCNGSVVG